MGNRELIKAWDDSMCLYKLRDMQDGTPGDVAPITTKKTSTCASIWHLGTKLVKWHLQKPQIVALDITMNITFMT